VRGFYRDLRAGPTEICILVTMSSSSRRGQRRGGSVLAEAEIDAGCSAGVRRQSPALHICLDTANS